MIYPCYHVTELPAKSLPLTLILVTLFINTVIIIDEIYVPDANTSMISYMAIVLSVAACCAVVFVTLAWGRRPACMLDLVVQVARGAQAGLGLVPRRLIVLL